MIRLNDYSHKSEYQGISLKCCGLLFLSTPHSGSTDADWNNFLLDIAQLTFAIRPEILNSLKSFDLLSAEGQEDFANMKHQPPFDAFYETQRTEIATLNRHVCFLLLPYLRLQEVLDVWPSMALSKTRLIAISDCHPSIGKSCRPHCFSNVGCRPQYYMQVRFEDWWLHASGR